MKKKKIILIVIMSIVMFSMIGLLIYKNYDKDSEVIVQSNGRDESVEQIEITNDFINIRLSNDSQSEALGKVYKGEIYTVLDKKEDEYYSWCLIKTNNGIEGYIAVKYQEESYVNFLEVKKEEDTKETE